ncbi:oligopeptide/dipeptide ABC transporter, ATPase subunit [Thermofilum pendens Hrk 5]|uniref:Oligopeptide/dipeptide ABC transporter, ATPase subunit n=1 Tax=Thermofilum pendens (strain DSM 2475 / Hrk 5) TaxID=368408 RepID=A1RZL7_THEPD|nr:ABC transporter ATP-binding protein [Thermofilum pendens]ABL78647.1 oligopeptide/dipeptide ABC transporter, ATPase subunit [Thermofilum pendens Hrk 5]
MSELVVVRDLKKYFKVRGSFSKTVKAVDGVSFEIREGETLGLVGESGCGKSTLGRVVIRLLEPTGGKVFFKGQDVAALKGEKLKQFRRQAQIVFQDPNTSLNPRMTILEILSEPLYEHNIPVDDPEDFITKQLESVGLGREHLYRYPHELSGGQKQRVAILRALLLNPSFVVLDEPTSSLDVSVQAQILNMLKDFQAQRKLSYLFISHDIGVVKYMSQRIAVMYLGKIVELGPSDAVFENPLHPYTKFLLSAVPVPDPKYARARKRLAIPGEPPSPINVPPGCRFHPRCPYATEKCRTGEPPVVEAEPGHFVACWLYSKG